MVWYALQTQPNAEDATIKRLDRLGFVDTYSPMAKIEVVRKGRVVTAEVPAFPSYLLCDMPPTAEAWRASSDTQGVSRMLGKNADGVPTPLRPAEVADIRRREGLDELEPPTKKRLRRNCAVRVRFGHFVNQIGVLVKRKRERARISLSLLGSEIEIDIPLQAIEPVESVAHDSGRVRRVG